MSKRNITKKSEAELNDEISNTTDRSDLFNAVVFSVSLGSFFYLWWTKSISNDQHREQLEFLLIVGLFAVAGVSSLIAITNERRRTVLFQRRGPTKSIIAVCAVVICVTGLSYRPTAQFPYLWHGFGWLPVFGALVSAVFFNFHWLVQENSRPDQERTPTRVKQLKKALNFTLTVFVFFVYGPMLVQTPSGIINGSDATHQVLEEIAGPLVGNFPAVNYLGTYTSLLGLPLALLRPLHLPGGFLMTVVLAWIAILTFGTVLMVFVLARRVMPEVWSRVLLLATCATILVTGQWGSASSNVESMSMIPGRTLLPVLVCFLIYEATRSVVCGASSKWFVAVGVVGVLAGLNNVEFGVPALAAAAFVSIAVGARLRKFRSVFGGFLAGFVGALLTYVLFSLLVKGPYDFWFRVGVYAGERYSPGEIFPTWSLHNVLLAIFVAAIVMGLVAIVQSAKSSVQQRTIAIAAMTIFSGFWGLAAFPYCAYRCTSGMYMSTQVYLVPSFLCVVGCFALVRDGRPPYSEHQFGRHLAAVPLSVLVVLGLTITIQAPNPIDEWIRVSGNGLTPGWSTYGDRAPANEWNLKKIDWLDVKSVVAARDTIPSESVGYFGYMGNSVQLATGIRNYSGINSGEVLMIKGTATIRRLACIKLDQSQPQYLIVVGFELPCQGYRRSSLDISPSDGIDVLERAN